MPARKKGLVVIPGLTGEQQILLTMCRALEKPGRIKSRSGRGTARLWQTRFHPDDIAWLSAVAVGEVPVTTPEETAKLAAILDRVRERLFGEARIPSD
jgi:hypothetical protein